MIRLRFILLAAALVGVGVASFLFGRATVDTGSRGFRPVVRAAEDIRARAVRPVSQEALVRAAVRGMLETLEDPYAAILGPGQAQSARDLLTGSFVGVGVWVESAEEGLRVTSVLAGSPARRARIVPGDVITEVDGRPMAGVSTSEAAPILTGQEGSQVRLRVRSGGSEREVRVVRMRVSLNDVGARLLQGSVAYVHPLQFGRGVAQALRAELGGLLDRGARAVVLDLRGNPGGLADEAVETASLFLADGSVARVREAGEPEREVPVSGDPLPGVPVAVLVDGGTASAAELVAAALQERGRAPLVGTQTFGKGSIVVVEDLESTESAIQFTTATFLTPGGEPIEGRGLLPDVPVLPAGPVDAQLDRALRVVLGEPSS